MSAQTEAGSACTEATTISGAVDGTKQSNATSTTQDKWRDHGRLAHKTATCGLPSGSLSSFVFCDAHMPPRRTGRFMGAD